MKYSANVPNRSASTAATTTSPAPNTMRRTLLGTCLLESTPSLGAEQSGGGGAAVRRILACPRGKPVILSERLEPSIPANSVGSASPQSVSDVSASLSPGSSQPDQWLRRDPEA